MALASEILLETLCKSVWASTNFPHFFLQLLPLCFSLPVLLTVFTMYNSFEMHTKTFPCLSADSEQLLLLGWCNLWDNDAAFCCSHSPLPSYFGSGLVQHKRSYNSDERAYPWLIIIGDFFTWQDEKCIHLFTLMVPLSPWAFLRLSLLNHSILILEAMLRPLAVST